MAITNILCVCHGNSDRSPLMAAVLEMFLKNAGHDVKVESAGILEIATKGGPASIFSTTSAKRLGLDMSGHNKRWVDNVKLDEFDLFVCLDRQVAEYLFGRHRIPKEKIYNVNISDPWPSLEQREHDLTAETIVSMAYRVVARKFSAE